MKVVNSKKNSKRRSPPTRRVADVADDESDVRPAPPVPSVPERNGTETITDNIEELQVTPPSATAGRREYSSPQVSPTPVPDSLSVGTVFPSATDSWRVVNAQLPPPENTTSSIRDLDVRIASNGAREGLGHPDRAGERRTPTSFSPHTTNVRLAGLEDRLKVLEQSNTETNLLLRSISERLHTSMASAQHMPDGDGGRNENSRPTFASPRPMLRYSSVMHDAVPHISRAFSAYTLSCSMMYSCVVEIFDQMEDGGLTPAGFLKFLRIAMFSLKKGEKRNEYNRGIGPHASKFRRRVLETALIHAQQDTFENFRTDEDTSDGDDRPLFPPWLKHIHTGRQNYVTRDHVASAQKRQESVTNDRASYSRKMRVVRGEQSSRQEQGEFVMTCAYSDLNHMLIQSRKHAPADFCQVLGFLFHRWDSVTAVKVDQSSLNMAWVTRSGCTERLRLVDVPYVVTLRDKNASADQENEQKFRSFAQTRSELMIVVRHDARIRKRGRANDLRNHIGREVQSFNRIIPLMDVAAYFLRAMCQFDKETSIFQIVRCHRRALGAIYSIALVLREMLECMEDPSVKQPGRDTESARDCDGGALPDSTEDPGDIGGVSIQDREILKEIFAFLRPTGILFDRAVIRATCAIPQEVFEAENIPTEREGGGPSTEDVDNNSHPGLEGLHGLNVDEDIPDDM